MISIVSIMGIIIFLIVIAFLPVLEYIKKNELKGVALDLISFFFFLLMFLAALTRTDITGDVLIVLILVAFFVIFYSIVQSINMTKGKTPTYHRVLQAIYKMRRKYEEFPSTYESFREESFRNDIISSLGITFEGSSTGETFIKKGKVDILVSHKGANVLIAECKIWHGKVYYLNAITQLLERYLPWHDTCAAVVLFVRSDNFSSALETVEEETSDHPCFVERKDKQDESWFNYRFHAKGDSKRETKLAVLLFHTPV